MAKVVIYDTTLRDGTQMEDISFSVEDKLRIAEKLDELGFHYIEGGWPGSNLKDLKFFKEASCLRLNTAKIAAFGATRRADSPAQEDGNLKALLKAGTRVVTIVGKSWDLHVSEDLCIQLEKNLEMVFDSIDYLKKRVDEVFFDAEHFFDGYKNNPEYALKTIYTARQAGADGIVLCDTNGGSLPHEVEEIVRQVKKSIPDLPLGIHTHNDAEMAVANTLVAVKEGVTHVQGTINGFGERCGNANLCSVIPNLRLKLKMDCISDEQMRKLKQVSRFVNELANLPGNKRQPFVGDSAFAHKGGLHISAVKKNPRTYEHILPEVVGNRQRFLVSELSGKGSVLLKAKEYNIDLKGSHRVVTTILKQLKELESQGYQYEGAEASFELVMKRALGQRQKYFELVWVRVISEKRKEGEESLSEATIMVKVGKQQEHTAATGDGPVHALDNALRKALEKFYPQLKEVKLLDYKVRVLDGQGTASKVRVLVESGDSKDKWGTVGVSENILEASWQALVDSVNYKLLKDGVKGVKR